ncbi:DUF6339 family protein [Brevibacillus brevis]|uniref:DUF6339 family protein n=1 Tax=Brevibacillus brevis TaxID=1393 RepID=UPI000D0ED174|nr:DUF6339 family protein [Brevibacillus brevis]PSJ63544.1 hypothetical protein C7J99_31290 [Brevibacillus brevis]RED33849.1 hypothetical protein DES34_10214 [Brevibacillus brevis]GEC93340.1 hypothetical protein BBR01nite_56710 [Brevibacillus brevis]VEF92581.1 Uncharacterised protein [Brevibacillus brevis]
MKIKFLSQDNLENLKTNIPHNLAQGQYTRETPWLDEFFQNDGWSLESNYHFEDIQLKKPEGTRNNFDLENTITLYSAFKNLSITDATDERIWTYLAHVPFWDYMQARWGIDADIPEEEDLLAEEEDTIQDVNSGKKKKDPEEKIRRRYFFQGKTSNTDRALFRNGIARLWWFGYVSFDENREDKFELTKILLYNQEIQVNLLERGFSRNRKWAKAILSVLADRKREGQSFYSRESFRELTKHINRLGGVTIIDALEEEDIKKIIIDQIEKLLNK